VAYDGNVRAVFEAGDHWVEPPTAPERKQAYKRFHDSSRSTRFYMDTIWATDAALVEGIHWHHTSPATAQRGSNRKIVVYPEQYDPDLGEVRATLNWTRPLATDVAALVRVDPQGWGLQFDPDRRDRLGSSPDRTVMDRVWHDFRMQSNVDISGQHDVANHWRVQMGSGLLKIHPDTANPYGWNISQVPLDRMVWDPSNVSPDIRRHRQWADCAAWAVEDVERAFGVQFSPETKKNLPTLGSLQAFSNLLQGIRQVNPSVGGDSKARALLLTEFYDDNWNRLTIFVHTSVGENQMRVMWDGPNPYRLSPESPGLCPFLKLDFIISLLGVWGVGIPRVVQTPQMVTALTMTNVLRHQIACTANRWLYQDGTIDDPETAFSPVVGAPLPWKGQVDKDLPPQMVTPPDIAAITKDLLAFMPQFGREVAHLPSVMRGEAEGSREAAQAIRERLAQAERPFSAIEERDYKTYRQFLTPFVAFLCNTARPATPAPGCSALHRRTTMP